MKENNKRVYVDMDDTLCDFLGAFIESREKCPKQAYPQAQIDFFRKLKPLPMALQAMELLKDSGHDVWILTRPSIMNPLCYMEKRLWVEDNLGIEWCERLILCPDKSLVKGDFLIDDQEWPGFEGEQILFGSPKFPSWREVLNYLGIKN
jgi:5'(3')-deoxyribonucleotidase